MIAKEYYVGEDKVNKVYLGDVLIYASLQTLPDYLLSGKANDAVEYALSTLDNSV